MDEAMELYLHLLILALCTAAAAMTVTKSRMFEPVRNWIAAHDETAGHLIGCPYCMSHWIAVTLLLCSGVSPLTFGFWLYAGAVVAVATLVVGLMLRSLFIQEQEIERLRTVLKTARTTIADQQSLLSQWDSKHH